MEPVCFADREKGFGKEAAVELWIWGVWNCHVFSASRIIDGVGMA